MLKLNLISPELKNEIKTRRIYLLVKPIAFTLFCFALLISLYAWAGKLVIANFREKFYAETMVNAVGSKMDTKFEMIDAHLASIATIQTDYVVPSREVAAIASLIGNGMYLETIRINYKDRSLFIRGWSGERTDLLAFKERLESSEYFDAVDLPLNSIVSKNDIAFDLTAKLSAKK